jgi:hypothetical protein
MERRENHHVPRGNFFGSTPAFPRVSFASEGSTASFLPVASGITDPGAVTPWIRCHPLRGGQPFLLGMAGRASERSRFRLGFVSTLPRVATRHPLISGRRIPTCLLAGEGIVQGSRTELHACTPPFLAATSCPGNAGRNGASGSAGFGMALDSAPASHARLPSGSARAHPTFPAPVVQRLTGSAPVPPLQVATPSPGGWRDGMPNITVLSAIVSIPAAWLSIPRSRHDIGRRGRRATMLVGMVPIPHLFGAVFLPASGKCDQ